MKIKGKLLASLKIWLAIYPAITLLLYLFGQPLALLPIYQRTLWLTLVLVPFIVFIGLPLVNHFLQTITSKDEKA